MAKVHQDLLEEVRSFLGAIGDEAVRGFVAGIEWDMPERRLEARPLPCLAWLPAAQAIAGEAGQPLAALLAAAGDRFRWGQTYTVADVGPAFMARYGWLEVFGTRGHFVNDRIAGGLLLLGPETVYPDHHHQAEEVYVTLTGGAEWRMDGGPYSRRAAGEVVHHAQNVSHAMRTGAEPLLAFYLWRGGPLAARSTLAAGNAAQEGGRRAHPGGETPPLRVT